MFHLKTLHDTACELSGLTQPRKIMETFLLTAMGLFGVARGLAVLMNARTRQGHLAQRGLSGPEAEACERSLARIAEHYLPEDSLPRHAEFVPPAQAADPGLLPADTAVVLKQKVDGTMPLLSAFGPRLSARAFRRGGYDRPAQPGRDDGQRPGAEPLPPPDPASQRRPDAPGR
ncbi:MAG: hypothetical protein MZV70_56010 [Desulfobacterales bacterium]|nr:hypothetical protein [Desulfobacterales bacterium]